MKRKGFVLLAVIAGMMLACNFSGAAGGPTSTPQVVVVTQLVTSVPTDLPAVTTTPAASAVPLTPTTAVTATASIPTVSPVKDPVNCRYGPGVAFEQMYALQVGGLAQITGKSADGFWWQVLIPEGNGQLCWVAASVVNTSGDLGAILPVAAPVAYVTDVKFQVHPDTINLGPSCSSSSQPFSFKATIHVNGPLIIVWHLETQQDGPMQEHKLTFMQYGSQEISYDYMPSNWKKGSYWVHLVITSPKSMTYEQNFTVKCQ